jgi:glutamate 5-kinase
MTGQLGGNQLALLHAAPVGGKQPPAVARLQACGIAGEFVARNCPRLFSNTRTRARGAGLLHLVQKRMTDSSRSSLARCKRPVIKIGSAVLAGTSGKAGAPQLDRKRFAALCDDVAKAAEGRTPVVVSSGAVALGVERLGLASRPREMALKQAAAAAGQSRLMRLYDDHLEERGLRCAQILLTHADIANRGRYLNARRALSELLARRVVPVINENDTVSVEEIKFGDNDALAAMVVDLVEADLLVILTDAGGLYSADPRRDHSAARIPLVRRVTPEIEGLASGTTGAGTGGMITKLRAARRATEAGVPCAIIPGEPGALLALFEGEDIGTLVLAQGERKRLRQRWMLDLKARGEIRVDEGARTALIDGKKSLLPSGVREVRGAFLSGDPVEITTLDGHAFARGLAVYSADEVRRISGLRSAEIESRLGYRLLDCVVHRDDLVVTS